MENKPLFWNDYPAIAEALHSKFPDVDLVAMEDSHLLGLIGSLDNFEDDIQNPPRDIISAIVTFWVCLQDSEGL